jgi:hypothetical protein
MVEPSDVAVGQLVRHRTQLAWGLGKVVHMTHDQVFVYFKDITGTPKEAVKQFKRHMQVLAVAEVQRDAVLDHLPPMVQDGVLKIPTSRRTTAGQAVSAFIQAYRDFDDPEYLKEERNYKWAAHDLCCERLLGPEGRRLLADGDAEAASTILRKIVQATNLLATSEIISFTGGLKEPDAALQMARRAVEFIDQDGAEAFAALVDAIEDLPMPPEGKKVLTWPVATLIPFLAKPDTHMFLKPMQTRKTADAYIFDLLYTPRPNWSTYERLRQLSRTILEDIRPLGARDMIDVQSFMWVVNGAPYMQPPKPRNQDA